MTFHTVDDPRAIQYLKNGREALAKYDYQKAMRNFKKCYKSRITKKLAALLLDQMANCMGELEFYDQQQEFLEELCELELNIENAEQLMKIYMNTNNEVKKKAFARKIKKLTSDNDDTVKRIIKLLSQVKENEEVLERGLDWLEKHPDDEEISRYIINTYIEQKKIENARNFAGEIVKRGLEDKLHMELAGLSKEEFNYEASRDHLLKHFEIHRENIAGVNKVAHTLMTNACYHGTLTGKDYIYWRERATEGTKPPRINNSFDRPGGLFRKIRVGFVSYDFRAHSVGKFVTSLFDAIHFNTGIETYCYYTYPDHEDEFTRMIKDRADVFRSVGRYSDKQLRKILLEDDLDILVDLNGQTAGTKLALLAERFAPIQITWMGFPFSSFYYNIDYIIGDYFFDPEDGETEKYCSEKILRMDPCYMCFAVGADLYIDPEPPQVKNGYITFGMMNNPNKYSEEAIRLWQKCLEAVPNSRLLIQLSKFGEGYVQDRMVDRFKRFGLDMDRVDIGTDSGPGGYYRTYNKCDVMLDTFPFGGATTTAEAIWMGVPVIGCGYPMRHGRMTYSFMNNVGLGGLCADSVEAYPQKVKEVSENAELLRDLRLNLRGKLKDEPLYDTEVFRTAFENAVRDVFADYCINNNKRFDDKIYEGKDGELLRDCVRGADIITHEMNRERGADENRLTAMLCEYKKLSAKMTGRLSEIYKNEPEALALALKAAEALDVFNSTDDMGIKNSVIKSVRKILIKFA